MRGADVLVLPSYEEGSALVTYEARASGCVLAVSDHAGAVATDDLDALVHAAGDVQQLTAQLQRLHDDPDTLARLRAQSIAGAPQLTWAGAAAALERCYATLISSR
jgi:glycosyltransferase involved in cell wall biosynthesis